MSSRKASGSSVLRRPVYLQESRATIKRMVGKVSLPPDAVPRALGSPTQLKC